MTERKIDDFDGSDGNCNFSIYASLVYEISFSDALYGRLYQDDESNRLNSSYGWSCGYRNGGCHGHGVEAVILMGDAPLLGVLAKYPVSWREGFGTVVNWQPATQKAFTSPLPPFLTNITVTAAPTNHLSLPT